MWEPERETDWVCIVLKGKKGKNKNAEKWAQSSKSRHMRPAGAACVRVLRCGEEIFVWQVSKKILWLQWRVFFSFSPIACVFFPLCVIKFYSSLFLFICTLSPSNVCSLSFCCVLVFLLNAKQTKQTGGKHKINWLPPRDTRKTGRGVLPFMLSPQCQYPVEGQVHGVSSHVNHICETWGSKSGVGGPLEVLKAGEQVYLWHQKAKIP